MKGPIQIDLSEQEWNDLWMLLYNVTVNNLVSPYVGDVADNVRGPLELSRLDGETVLDPLDLQQLLVLSRIEAKVARALGLDKETP